MKNNTLRTTLGADPSPSLTAFFRSKKPTGMTSEGGYDYQPAGIVLEKYTEGCPSGKDLVVMFLDPFDLRVVSQWRGINEVELYMVEEWEWRAARERYAKLDTNSDFWLPMKTAPKDNTEIIILFDSATVDIVRLCWWNDGIGCDFEQDPEARGWWSYSNSVSQELIDTQLMHPLGWMPHPDRSDNRSQALTPAS